MKRLAPLSERIAYSQAALLVAGCLTASCLTASAAETNLLAANPSFEDAAFNTFKNGPFELPGWTGCRSQADGLHIEKP